jgi:hypothetical protein
MLWIGHAGKVGAHLKAWVKTRSFPIGRFDVFAVALPLGRAGTFPAQEQCHASDVSFEQDRLAAEKEHGQVIRRWTAEASVGRFLAAFLNANRHRSATLLRPWPDELVPS